METCAKNYEELYNIQSQTFMQESCQLGPWHGPVRFPGRTAAHQRPPKCSTAQRHHPPPHSTESPLELPEKPNTSTPQPEPTKIWMTPPRIHQPPLATFPIHHSDTASFTSSSLKKWKILKIGTAPTGSGSHHRRPPPNPPLRYGITVHPATENWFTVCRPGRKSEKWKT